MVAQISQIVTDGLIVLSNQNRKFLSVSNNSVSEAFICAGTGVVATLGQGHKLNKSGAGNDSIVFEDRQATNLLSAIGSAGAIDLSVMEI